MAGTLVTDKQVRRFMNHTQAHFIEIAAVKPSFSHATGGKPRLLGLCKAWQSQVAHTAYSRSLDGAALFQGQGWFAQVLDSRRR